MAKALVACRATRQRLKRYTASGLSLAMPKPIVRKSSHTGDLTIRFIHSTHRQKLTEPPSYAMAVHAYARRPLNAKDPFFVFWDWKLGPAKAHYL
jgi:hypothetical protein